MVNEIETRKKIYKRAWRKRLYGISELAEMWGVSRQRAGQIVDKPNFPHPYDTLSAGPFWETKTILAYTKEEGMAVSEDNVRAFETLSMTAVQVNAVLVAYRHGRAHPEDGPVLFVGGPHGHKGPTLSRLVRLGLADQILEPEDETPDVPSLVMMSLKGIRLTDQGLLYARWCIENRMTERAPIDAHAAQIAVGNAPPR